MTGSPRRRGDRSWPRSRRRPGRCRSGAWGRARIAALARRVARRARTRRTSEPIGSESSHARNRSNSVSARSADRSIRGAAHSPAVCVPTVHHAETPLGPGGAAGGPAAAALVAAHVAAPPGHLHPPDRGRHAAADDQHLAERQLRDLRRGQHRDPADGGGGAAGEVVERGHVLVAFTGQGDVGGQVLVVAGAAEDQHRGGVVEDRRRPGRAVALPQLRPRLGADVDGDVRPAHVGGPRLQRQRADDRRLVQRQRQRRLQPPRGLPAPRDGGPRGRCARSARSPAARSARPPRPAGRPCPARPAAARHRTTPRTDHPPDRRPGHHRVSRCGWRGPRRPRSGSAATRARA